MGRKVKNGASVVVGGCVAVWATGGFWGALITIPRAEARADERIRTVTSLFPTPRSLTEI